jgi:hypothetical protein
VVNPAAGGTLPTPCCLQVTGNTAFLDLSLQSGRFASVGTGFGPYEFPWSAKPFGGFGELVLRIIMLPEALFNITGLAAIVSTAGFTLDDIDPVRQVFSHKKSPLK